MKKNGLQEMKRFCEEESGVGVVEIILVLGRDRGAYPHI